MAPRGQKEVRASCSDPPCNFCEIFLRYGFIHCHRWPAEVSPRAVSAVAGIAEAGSNKGLAIEAIVERRSP